MMKPSSVEQAQAMLAELGSAGQRALFIGGGTQMRPGPAMDVELSTTGLHRLVEYAPSDQVVVAEAGMTLAALQAELKKNHQRLALDPPHPERATLGGIVAANSFGPLRTRYGAVRDLIIGISIVRADGTLAKGGGKVVKTVAGFDLPKLMCGSYGTLGLIVTVTFRVHPLPEKSISLVARDSDPVAIARRVRELQLEPAAVLAVGRDVYVRFEGFSAGVSQQREKLRELPEAYWPADADAPVRLKAAAKPTQFAQVERALAPLEGRLEWLPMLGLGFVYAQQADAATIEAARRELLALGGSLVVEKAPFAVDVFGPPPPSISLQRSLKAQFDPRGILSPGRFVGGI